MNLKKVLKTSVFALAWLAVSMQAEQISFEAPFSSSGYKKALDMCMQVWGDVCVLRDNQEINAERALLVDVVAGRLTYLDAAVTQMLAHEAVAKPQDIDLTYLSNLVIRLEICCDQLVERDSNERVKCFKPLLQNVKAKLVKK